jgi:hypothetical protein
MEVAPATLAWLMQGDPAIRWQVERDLQSADTAVWSAERARVAATGWGAELLRHQGDDGRWGSGSTAGSGLYSPKWTSTTYTLYLLRLLGLAPGHPQALAGCTALLEGGLYLGREFRFSNASRGYVQEGGPEAGRDLGVTALVLASCLYFGGSHPALGAVVAFLLTRQQPGGAWWPDNGPVAEAYGMETTRLVLDALAEWRRSRPNGPADPALTRAITQGQTFLLEQHLGASADGKPAWLPRRPNGSGDRCGSSALQGGRALARAQTARGQDVCENGDAGRAEPLEHPARTARAAVVGRLGPRTAQIFTSIDRMDRIG